MSDLSWRRVSTRENRSFSEKAYRRPTLRDWDARWHALSIQARYFFLNEVKGPIQKQVVFSQRPSVTVERFPPQVLKELTDAGFVEVQAARSRAFKDRVVAVDGVYDFSARLRSLKRFHLLDADRPVEFEKYVNATFYSNDLYRVLKDVLFEAGVRDLLSMEELLTQHVMHRVWLDSVARSLEAPLVGRILDVLRDANGPVSLEGLSKRLDWDDTEEVRSAVEALVTHLALVEDLHPETWELMVGFLPAVREQVHLASQPRERPPLVVVEHPAEVGPEGSVIVSDLRAFLLEVVTEPPRLRQDRALFQKELERLRARLEPLAELLSRALNWSDERRLEEALGWARALGLVTAVSEDKQRRLHLTAKGQKWLTSGPHDQYLAIYGLLNKPAGHRDLSDPDQSYFFMGLDPFSSVGPSDTRFLSVPVSVMLPVQGKRMPYCWEAHVDDHAALRKAIDQAFTELKPGVFYRLDSVVSYLTIAEHNPLNRGCAPEQVVVFWATRTVPPLEEQREEAGRLLLESFVRRRLIPLGCLRAAIDGEGQLAIARQPRYDACFGRAVSPAELAPAETATARVVVQPDFSVMVIGPNPAPAADLLPFCEPTSRGSGQGAMVLKLTRASVIKAVGKGFKPAEIVARLQKHASSEVPANVLREIEGWSRWVRQVTSCTMTLLRCPDQDTADRVMGAIKSHAERVSPMLVAIDPKWLTVTERIKLRGHGIFVEGHTESRPSKPTRRGRR